MNFLEHLKFFHLKTFRVLKKTYCLPKSFILGLKKSSTNILRSSRPSRLFSLLSFFFRFFTFLFYFIFVFQENFFFLFSSCVANFPWAEKYVFPEGIYRFTSFILLLSDLSSFTQEIHIFLFKDIHPNHLKYFSRSSSCYTMCFIEQYFESIYKFMCAWAYISLSIAIYLNEWTPGKYFAIKL